jgi:hypothetical protein
VAQVVEVRVLSWAPSLHQGIDGKGIIAIPRSWGCCKLQPASNHHPCETGMRASAAARMERHAVPIERARASNCRSRVPGATRPQGWHIGESRQAIAMRMLANQSVEGRALSRMPRCGTAGSATRCLNGRARHVAVRAEDAAIAQLRLQQRGTALALVEIPASVGRHGLGRVMPANGAGDGRDELRHACRTISLSKAGSR